MPFTVSHVAAVLPVTAGAVLGVAVGALASAGSAEVALFRAVTFGGAGLAVGVVLACALWWARAPRPAEVAARRG